MNHNSDILFITSFKDINRSTWSQYSRTNHEYFTYFLNLVDKIEYTLIVYIEDKILEDLKKLNNTAAIFKPNIIFKNLQNVDTFFEKYIDNDKIIMNSDFYQNKIPIRRKNLNPEHIYSEYNFVNHSKINLVSDAKKQYPNYLFYSWIDFGYARESVNIPKNINVYALPAKIIYHCLIYPSKKIDANIMLTTDHVFITGSSYIIHNTLVEKFEELYENKIKEWQMNYITDDDQNLILQIYYDNPQLFHLIQNNKWFSLYNII